MAKTETVDVQAIVRDALAQAMPSLLQAAKAAAGDSKTKKDAFVYGIVKHEIVEGRKGRKQLRLTSNYEARPFTVINRVAVEYILKHGAQVMKDFDAS